MDFDIERCLCNAGVAFCTTFIALQATGANAVGMLPTEFFAAVLQGALAFFITMRGDAPSITTSLAKGVNKGLLF